MPFNDINRGAITLNPCVDRDWVEELIVASDGMPRFHICDMVENHDGSIMVLFCDGQSCKETRE